MIWHTRDEIPPLGQEARDAGGQNGGHSVPLIHRHRSGRISAGRALLHNGTVWHWYPGKIGDYTHSPESKEDDDPIVAWMLCPDAAEIVGLMAMALAMQDDGR